MFGFNNLSNWSTGTNGSTDLDWETAYMSGEPVQLEQMGTVSETIHPYQRGRVFFQNTYWFAWCPFGMTIPPETQVIVRDRQNLTLLVEPLLFSSQTQPSSLIGS
jgi:hypothetical protein